MKKYLKDLETELRKNNLSEREIEEILADHEEMIESAINEGLSDEELVEKFGNPEEVAKELSDFSDKKEEASENNENIKEYVFKDVQENYSVKVELINEDFQFDLVDSNEITVKLVGGVSTKKYDIEFTDNTLYIKTKKSFGFGYFERDKKRSFKISIPRNILINEFKIKEVNGDGKIAGFKSKIANIETNNGDMVLLNIVTDELKLNSINGDALLENVTCNDMKVSLISGDMDVRKLKVKDDIYMNTVSGDLKIVDSECNELTLKTVSGDVQGREFYPRTIGLNTVSGDVKIVNTQRDRTINIKSKKSLSGDITIITK